MSTLTDEATFGPCSPWITGDDVAASCTQAATAVGTDTAQLDQYAEAASEALWAMSGGQFDGKIRIRAKLEKKDATFGGVYRYAKSKDDLVLTGAIDKGAEFVMPTAK